MASDAWVLIVERREPSELPYRGPASSRWAYHDEVFGPFEDQDAAWRYSVARDGEEWDHAHDVQLLRAPGVVGVDSTEENTDG